MSDGYAGHVAVITPEGDSWRADCLCGWLAAGMTEAAAADRARRHTRGCMSCRHGLALGWECSGCGRVGGDSNA